MGDRIEEGYREKLKALLGRLPPGRTTRPFRIERAVDLLMSRSRALARREAIDLPRALGRVFEGVRRSVATRAAVVPGDGPPPRFVCDAHMGGLARWLRAAGYQAWWSEGVEDSALVQEAARLNAILLTGDVGVLRRRAIRNGTVSAVFLPSSLGPLEQLGMVMRELALVLRQPRCMACGGELAPVEKHAVADRIPPRTARWKDEYFVCAECGKLYWRGTHWERIEERLERAVHTRSA